jgi:hypothetical protein
MMEPMSAGTMSRSGGQAVIEVSPSVLHFCSRSKPRNLAIPRRTQNHPRENRPTPKAQEHAGGSNKSWRAKPRLSITTPDSPARSPRSGLSSTSSASFRKRMKGPSSRSVRGALRKEARAVLREIPIRQLATGVRSARSGSAGLPVMARGLAEPHAAGNENRG